ncbi:MAG: hypothetical protein II738_06965, partial [Clostridia bacterium]|nr:hypothetical protein [Clostridia bacterium]
LSYVSILLKDIEIHIQYTIKCRKNQSVLPQNGAGGKIRRVFTKKEAVHCAERQRTALELAVSL